MILLSLQLSVITYAQNILLHLIRRTSFMIIASILLGLIVCAIIAQNVGLIYIPVHSVIIWILLWLAYVLLIPFVIYQRAKSIYHNTKFLQRKMQFQFDKDKIVWSADERSVEFFLKEIYNISATSKALIISFSPYQVIPIPYEFISCQQWEDIFGIVLKYFPKIRSRYYNIFVKREKGS